MNYKPCLPAGLRNSILIGALGDWSNPDKPLTEEVGNGTTEGFGWNEIGCRQTCDFGQRNWRK
jgi:hypothetical protein